MNIIVCYKLVPEEQDIVVNKDRTLDLTHAVCKISLYDLNAVEAAVQLASAIGSGSKVTALSVGGATLENSKARKDILSRGPDDLTVVIDPALENALPAATAHALATALRGMSYDLVLCGEGSGDLYAQQVGLLTGAFLGIPAVNNVHRITPGQGHVVVERVLETEMEVLQVPLPAVLSLCADCNVPRIPGMKAILAAGKKPVTVLEGKADPADAAPTRLVSVLAPEQTDRQHVIFEGDSEDNLVAFAKQLRKALP